MRSCGKMRPTRGQSSIGGPLDFTDRDGRRLDGPARPRATAARSSRKRPWRGASRMKVTTRRQIHRRRRLPDHQDRIRARAAPGSVNGTAETSIRV
jgi:hypothetical protein